MTCDALLNLLMLASSLCVVAQHTERYLHAQAH
jgi:hypothetical protein